MSHASKRLRSGFTLIELLVVIAIIAILAAILFPVFATAREKARQTACLSNCKQIGTALMMYAQDHDEGIPSWSTEFTVPAEPFVAGQSHMRLWDFKLLPYVKNGATTTNPSGGVWQCPSREGELTDRQRTYGISMGVVYQPSPTNASVGTYRFPFISDMAVPASTIFVGDGGSGGRLGRPIDYRGYYEYYVDPRERTRPTRDAPFRHNMGANYVFCDGHAKWFKGETVYPHPTPPSVAYSTANGRAWCAYANYFGMTQNERQQFLGRAHTAGNTACTLQ